MDTGFAVLALLMAFTGFFMLVGSFGVLVYALYKRGRESEAGRAAATGEGQESGQQ